MSVESDKAARKRECAYADMGVHYPSVADLAGLVPGDSIRQITNETKFDYDGKPLAAGEAIGLLRAIVGRK